MSEKSFRDKICVEQILPHHQEELDSLRVSSSSYSQFDRLRAAFFTKKIWPAGAKVRYYFYPGSDRIPRTAMTSLVDEVEHQGGSVDIDPLQKEVGNMSVTDAITEIIKKRIEPISGLKFIYVEQPHKANIRISFDPDGGAWSLVGTDCLHLQTGATMNLGWFDVPTVLHEFGHVLGMVHEHSNPNGNPIKWDKKAVYKWAEETQGWNKTQTDKNILVKYEHNQVNGSSFDPLSIMLYFFPGSLTTNHKGTHQNLRLSGEDVLWISKFYPQSKVDVNNFYERIYGKSLQSSEEQSVQAAKEIEEDDENSSMHIYILIFIIIVLITLGLYLVSKRKK